MCQYCEFNAPDYCGSPMPNEKKHLEMTLSADIGLQVSGHVDGKRISDFFHCNYCPMCGRDLLGYSDSNKPHYKPEETYAILPRPYRVVEEVVTSWEKVLDYMHDATDNKEEDCIEVFQKVGEVRLKCVLDWV